MNRPFSKENMQIAKRYTTTIITRETEMKAPVRYHLLAVKSSIIQKKEINADKDVEKREHLYIVGGNVH